jgi:hypothetical protein
MRARLLKTMIEALQIASQVDAGIRFTSDAAGSRL